MLQKTKKTNFSILLIADISALAFCFLFATILTTKFVGLHLPQFKSIFPALEPSLQSFILPAVVVVLCHISLGLYQTSTMRESIRGVFRRLILSAVLSIVVLQSIQLFTPEDMNVPASIWFVTSGLATILQMFSRYAVWIKGFGMGRRKILVIGAGERASFFPRRIRRASDRKYWELIGFVPLKTTHSHTEIIHPSIALHENVHPAWIEDTQEASKGLVNLIESKDVSMVILANTRKERIPTNELLHLRMSKGLTVVELEDFIEHELGQIAVEQMKPEHLLTASGYHLGRPWFDMAQYLMNLALALMVLSVTWPVMLITALLIYLDDGRRDGAPIFFRQQRVGLGGVPFNLYKFRSMGLHAEKNGAQWATANDSRVTRLGAFLRKYRIDELPQLLNVIKGDMLFVGPRPERPEFVKSLSKDIPYFTLRNSVKPGLTGWAQVHYGYVASPEASYEKLKFDLFYIKHRSLMLDWYILFRTVEVVLMGRGQ